MAADMRSWESRPVRSRLLRAVVFLVPLGVSVAVGTLVAGRLPAPSSGWGTVGWWLTVLGASTLGLYGADRAARRLLPLATLLHLSMVFPDRAPSRIKIARRISGSRAIARELEAAERHGITGDRQQAAETILTLVGALGEYDSRTRGHSERTQLFVSLLADELKLDREDRGRLVWAALVHDIGKLKVPHDILNKPGRPTDEEWDVLHTHPMQGAHICEPLRRWLGEWYHAIEQHHERYDGQGYPLGLAGEQISYGARIVSVADSYEVMTAARPYKRPMTAVAARAELTRCAGHQFDPEVVRAFLNISLGRMNRAAGPLAWFMQLIAVRPGPILGQVIGGVAGAVAAGAAVLGLQLTPGASTPAAAQAPVAVPDHPSASSTTPGPSGERPAARPQDRESGTSEASGPFVPAVLDPGPETPAAPAGDDPVVPSDDPGPDPGTGSGPTPSPGPSPTPEPTPPPSQAPTPSPTPTPTPGPSPSPSPSPTPGPTLPVARGDVLAVNEDAAATVVDVLGNDTYMGPVTITVSPASNGTTTVDGAGVVRYQPTTNYNGSDSFSYTVREAAGATASALVSVTVGPLNDAPTAGPVSTSVQEDPATPLVVAVLSSASDVDAGDTLSLVTTGLPATSTLGGTVTAGTGTNAGKLLYQPAPNVNGTDSFSYTVRDLDGATDSDTVSVTVTPANDAPTAGPVSTSVAEDPASPLVVAVLSSASDVDGDTLTLDTSGLPATTTQGGTVSEGTGTDAGKLLYQPAHNFAGVDSFTYTVQESAPGAETASGTVTVTVSPVNDAPVALPDAVSADTATTILVTRDAAAGVLANDTDPEGSALTVTSDDSASIVIAADGSFTTAALVPGTYVANYTVSDGTATSTGSLTITVTALPPVQTTLYLQSPTGTTDRATLAGTAPAGPTADLDADGNPGLTIKSSSMHDDETDPLKFQEWEYPAPGGGLTLNGGIELDLWTSLEGKANQDLDYAAWIYECAPTATDDTWATCTQLASIVNIHVDNWSTTTTWQKRTVTIGSVSETIDPSNTLRLRLAFNHSDVWVPFEPAYASALRITQ